MSCSNIFSHLQAFHLIDCGGFHHLLKFCCLSLSERDIPHCHTLHAEILQCAHIAEGKVHKNMKKVPSKISFTFNAWTSAPGDPYISLMVHYIDAPTNCPNAWELRSEQLIFQEIQGRHTGKNMGDILSHSLDRYELCGKVRSLSLAFYCLIELLLHSTGWLVYE